MNINQLTKAYNVGILQGKAYRVFQNNLTKVLGPFNLTIPEWKALGQLHDNTDMKASDIAESLDIDAPMVTVLLKSLEEKKYINRTPNKEDKRVTIITLTTKTKKVIPEIEQIARKEFKEILKGVSKIEIAIYIRVLELVVKQGKTRKL